MYAKINWKPSNQDLRKFGLAMIIGFGLIGGIFYWKDFFTVAKYMWILSGTIGLLAITVPPLAYPFYLLWMGIAFVMGTIVSFLVVAIIYYCIITPVGLIIQLIGRDALRMKKSSFSEKTYWHTHPSMDDKKKYERLF